MFCAIDKHQRSQGNRSVDAGVAFVLRVARHALVVERQHAARYGVHTHVCHCSHSTCVCAGAALRARGDTTLADRMLADNVALATTLHERGCV
jgi:hypothetical protein